MGAGDPAGGREDLMRVRVAWAGMAGALVIAATAAATATAGGAAVQEATEAAGADSWSWTARPAAGMNWDGLAVDPAIRSAFQLMGVGEKRRHHQPDEVLMGLIIAAGLSDGEDAIRRQELRRLQELACWGAFRFRCQLRPGMPAALGGEESEDFAEMLRRFSPNFLARKPFPNCGGTPHEDGQTPRDGDHDAGEGPGTGDGR